MYKIMKNLWTLVAKKFWRCSTCKRYIILVKKYNLCEHGMRYIIFIVVFCDKSKSGLSFFWCRKNIYKFIVPAVTVRKIHGREVIFLFRVASLTAYKYRVFQLEVSFWIARYFGSCHNKKCPFLTDDIKQLCY